MPFPFAILLYLLACCIPFLPHHTNLSKRLHSPSIGSRFINSTINATIYVYADGINISLNDRARPVYLHLLMAATLSHSRSANLAAKL